jgi:hypothetical protein
MSVHGTTFNTPANPSGDSEFYFTFAGTLSDHVSLLATRVASTYIYIQAGNTEARYYIYANASGGSRTVSGTDPMLRVIRGGYYTAPGDSSTAAYRGGVSSSDAATGISFRLVRTEGL